MRKHGEEEGAEDTCPTTSQLISASTSFLHLVRGRRKKGDMKEAPKTVPGKGVISLPSHLRASSWGQRGVLTESRRFEKGEMIPPQATSHRIKRNNPYANPPGTVRAGRKAGGGGDEIAEGITAAGPTTGWSSGFSTSARVNVKK